MTFGAKETTCLMEGEMSRWRTSAAALMRVCLGKIRGKGGGKSLVFGCFAPLPIGNRYFPLSFMPAYHHGIKVIFPRRLAPRGFVPA